MAHRRDRDATSCWTADPRELLRVSPAFRLDGIDRAATPGWSGTESDATAYTAAITPLLGALQERLFAAAQSGMATLPAHGTPHPSGGAAPTTPDATAPAYPTTPPPHTPINRVLVIAQGLDTAGKGSLARHVMSLVDPQGVSLTAFKVPTPEEASHHFLRRIRRALPPAGHIGFFDRSHYEDLLVPTVNGTLSPAERASRLADVRDFEVELAASGTAVVKICLMVSYAEQGKRLLERVDRPDKRWKYSPADMEARSHWEGYQRVYEDLLRESSWPGLPWYLIPADHKWYARLAVTEILLRTLAASPWPWPEASFDVEAERARIRATLPPNVLERYDARLPRKLARVTSRITAVDDAAARLA